MLDITHGKIRGGGTVVDIRADLRVQPMVKAPRDGRPVRIFWRSDLYHACWDEGAQWWREIETTRVWRDEELLGWAPWPG